MNKKLIGDIVIVVTVCIVGFAILTWAISHEQDLLNEEILKSEGE